LSALNAYESCDLCGNANPQFILQSSGLDGPLVQCIQCGFRYVGKRKSALVFGQATADQTVENVRVANRQFRNLRLEEEHRLAMLNSKWRLQLIRKFKPDGKLLEIGCARGDFLSAARDTFEARGVEPNPELAESSSRVAPVFGDVIERTPWTGFDVIASFHVIEHVDSPRRFIRAAVERLKPDGLLVIETPNIDSLPFKLMKARWREFIPEHYFFFDPRTMSRLLQDHGLDVVAVQSIGKYASISFIFNRLSRYVRWLPEMNRLAGITFRVNPMDIMLVFATKRG
jgi:2-polyprenyl-3-methyl-5-hydroxy-6-metoxy-1,4-benzoquinol methylase